jgi:hypothetical protein
MSNDSEGQFTVKARSIRGLLLASLLALVTAACGNEPDKATIVDPHNNSVSASASAVVEFSENLNYMSQMSMKKGVHDFLITLRTSDVYRANMAMVNGDRAKGIVADLASCSEGAGKTQINPQTDAIIAFDLDVKNLTSNKKPSDVVFDWDYSQAQSGPPVVPILIVYKTSDDSKIPQVCDYELSRTTKSYRVEYEQFQPGEHRYSAGFFVLTDFYSQEMPNGNFRAVEDILVGYERFVVNDELQLGAIPHVGFEPLSAYPGYYAGILNGTRILDPRVDRELAVTP